MAKCPAHPIKNSKYKNNKCDLSTFEDETTIKKLFLCLLSIV